MHSSFRSQQGERGQALVLLVLALVGLVGFAALALDGGNLYTEQRRAQAAADNAVMAAAYARMDGEESFSVLEGVAHANALTNNYDDDGVDNWVTFYWPPVHGPLAGDDDYVEVMITRTVPTALAHFVYGQSPIPVTVFAVAEGIPDGPRMDGYALAAMKPGCDGSSTITIQGNGGGSNGGAWLYGGGAFSNSSCPDGLDMNGGNFIYTNGPPIDVVGGYAGGATCTSPGTPNGCNFYPAPTSGVDESDQDVLAGTPAATPPNCAALPARTLSSELSDADGTSIRPGRYTTLDMGNETGVVTMQPGIYCLSGGQFNPGRSAVVGAGVLIYLQDEPAWINASGNQQRGVTLTAPTLESTGCTGVLDESYDICRFLNIVVLKYVGANDCSASNPDIDFTGQSYKNVTGLIYAPRSLARFGGQGDYLQTGQTIAGCVKYNGNGRLEIHYDPNATYSPPPAVELHE